MLAEIITRAIRFIKYFIQPDLIAGGTYASRNTEYLIPHGFELFSALNRDAAFVASVVRKSLLKTDSFPGLFDDRYFTYVGYTWLQAYMDANDELDGHVDQYIHEYFGRPFKKIFNGSGLVIINDDQKHLIVNMHKGGSFRLYDKKNERAFSDSGIFVRAEGKWYTSGWLSESEKEAGEDSLSVSGYLWKVPDKTLTPVSNVALRLFQLTFGRWDFISLWIKERLRDMLITKTKPSDIRYNRRISFSGDNTLLIEIKDVIDSRTKFISKLLAYTNETSIYVPSSRYYVSMKGLPFKMTYEEPIDKTEIRWVIRSGSEIEFYAIE